MSNDSDTPQEIAPSELVQKLRVWLTHQKKTADRNRHISQLFPEGIGPGEAEKIVLRIRRHFPEVSRAELRSMNPGDLDAYLEAVIKEDTPTPPKKRGPKPKPITGQRSAFAKRRLSTGLAWPDILAEYKEKYPEDTDVTAGSLRQAYNRDYPAK